MTNHHNPDSILLWHKNCYGHTDSKIAKITPVYSKPLLTATDLECYRDDRLLFRDINLLINAGEILQVYGPNGSGKTSLLRILCGLTLPSRGEIRWRGKNITKDRRALLSEITYIGHHNGIKPELSPAENLKIASSLIGREKTITPEVALARFDLSGFDDIPAYTLSAGQRRRVALARLLFSHATCWILDEPLTALDKTGVAIMESLLEEHAQSGGITILTTHQPLDISTKAIQEIHLGS
uniref:Heme exporter protein A n=1 Tax=Candidatus Kentrum sp. MB TaxID=2138164 RepID=A0A450XDI2_9GAMM|nr:MAG: heme exporter protein A [Candidatus Kentron sp. MB]VFK33591.1 MAG: heme exporter protein A [Candidatus Kentron sp. MB]VFK76270.1 MAG: heme exporter protein A [Candidatus Kentron sp. MB]